MAAGLVPDHAADLVEHRRDRLGGGPDALRQNEFAVVDAQQWLQRQRGAQPGRRPADPPAAAQVVQPVHHDVGVGAADGRTGLGGNGLQVGTGRGGPRRGQRDKAGAHRRRFRVHHRHPGTELPSGLLGSAVGARQCRRDVHAPPRRRRRRRPGPAGRRRTVRSGWRPRWWRGGRGCRAVSSSTPSRRSVPSTRMCRGTTSIPCARASSAGSRADESVTTTTAIPQPPGLWAVTPASASALSIELGDGLVRGEVPVDAVRVAAAGSRSLRRQRLSGRPAARRVPRPTR